ncbi:MAG: ParB/RepB/Spo0J family partition protein [Armatimonadetes bacterium]|nr:MAG: ParB/RepB/Spo0J family partition protein [Armatimonadota bacterium]MBL1151518.1 ParB/RepB/Spo0J family partition protein [Armatimonadota bacterium]NOG38177.1 ParB/RepB/Spo0J family partition protein [Armatimonadota bacterium]
MRRSIGRGLSQLLSEREEVQLMQVPLDQIRANPRQPRSIFDDESLAELTESVRRVGVLQPIVLRKIAEDRFEIVAGERRFRAAQRAELAAIPAVVRSASSQVSFEMALVENIQREDISPIDKAHAYRRLMDEFGLSQEEVAIRVGKTRSAVANTIRLLKLPQRIQDALILGTLTEAHGRALLSFSEPAVQLALFERILKTGMTVAALEALAKEAAPKGRKKRELDDPHWERIESGLRETLGAPVSLSRKGKGGRITIEFFSDDELTRILDAVGVQI